MFHPRQLVTDSDINVADVNVATILSHAPYDPPSLHSVNQVFQKTIETPEIPRIKPHEWIQKQVKRNGAVAANELPNEILVRIFICFGEPSRKLDNDGDHGDSGGSLDYDIPEFRREVPKWTMLMLVCRHWRDVALATPALWRTIDVGKTSSNWMKLALTHSDDATIDVSFHSDVNEEHVSLLQPYFHRLRSLRLRSWSLSALPIISDTLPALDTLEVYSNRDGLQNGPTDLGITREHFPSLRSLRLASTIVPRDMSFYAPLRKLTLVQCPFEASLDQFIELLASCPNLEHLELEHFLQQLSGGELNVKPPRSLPSLVSMRLFYHAPMHSTRFLSRIFVPSSSAKLAVAALYDEGQPGDTLYTSIPSNLARTFPSLATLTWARLTVAFEHWFIDGHPTLLDPDDIPLVELALASSELAFEWKDRMSDGLADLLAVFGASPLTHLEVVGLCAPVSAETWATVFQAFPSLVSLDAGTEGALFIGLHEAGSESLASSARRDGTTSGSQTPACLGLKRISVTPYSRAPHTPETVLEPLIDCLRYRAEKGTRLKQLHLDLNMEMDSAKGYLPQLEDLVSNVEVNCRRTSY